MERCSSLGAAAVNGYSRKYKNWLPTIIESVHITRCLIGMMSTVTAKATGTAVIGEGQCVAEGRVVLEVSGVRISLAESTLKSVDDHAAGRKEWGPDLDFMDLKGLISLPIDHEQTLPLLNDLAQLCLLSSSRAIKDSPTTSDHSQKYIDWIKSQVQSPELLTVKDLDEVLLSARIQNLLGLLSNTPASSAANALHQICTGFSKGLSGKLLEEILLNETTITDVYNFIDDCDTSLLLQNLAHFKPSLRVLEIGGGRGSSASDNIQNLTLDSGKICCSRYTLATTSFVSEKDQTKIFEGIENVTLNVSKDLEDQQFADREYDLVIAKNALSVNKTLRTSLMNVKSLLHPDGRFLLQETRTNSAWVKYIFGINPTFWNVDLAREQSQPYLRAEEWQSQLSLAGFRSFDVVIQNELTTVVVARSLPELEPGKRITVLCSEVLDERAQQLLERLTAEGYVLDTINIWESPPAQQDIVSILELDGPFFHEINADRYQAFKDFLSKISDSGVMWITSMCQMGCKDPRYGQVLGLSRNIRSEKQLHFATCEVDNFSTSFDSIVKVFKKFHSRQDNDKLKPDFEFCIKDGQINIGRVYPVALGHE